ncbi:PDR/VanB family oxidoreductase [Elioraea rosea]|uniref:PDR/VanB family oxidoreductase n=1 Tax=Elioraea rosea TaxID=2492390 RepID=UPI001183875D|nr:PDR/VanB family oxidoreductase [Elioraea rosea]
MRVLMPVTVADARMATPRVRVLTLRHARRDRLPPFQGGAHTLLTLPDGTKRAYSIASDPAREEAWDIAVLREGHGSSILHELPVGSRLYATHPQAGFGAAAGAARHVMVAGGIGLTPFLSMLPPLIRAGADATLHLCAREEGSAPLVAETRVLLGERLVTWFGDARRRLDLAALLAGHEPGTHAYCCGPQRMLEAFRAATAHWPDEAIHTETFLGLAPERATSGEAFSVRLARSGVTLDVPANRSLLDVLREAGVAPEASCEGGACGTCTVPVLAGRVVHRDLCLSGPKRARMMTTCVSRGEGELILDL